MKGLKEEFTKNLNLQHFEDLLFAKSELELKQNKLFRDDKKHTLNLSVVIYKLKMTENKRAIIYLENRAVYTKPFILNE